MSRSIFAAVLVLVASVVAAQTPSPQATAEIASTDGGFQVVMPCQPDPRPESPVIGLVLVSCSADTFFARVSALPVIVLGEPDAELTDEVSLAVDDLEQGQLVTSQAITLGQYPGRAFRASSANGVVTMHRIVLAGDRNRLYHVMAAASADAVPEERMNAFLGSFAIVDAPVSDVRPGIITARVASKMNRLLPAPIDQDTELMFTVGLPGVLAYNYRLNNLALADIDTAKFLATMKDVMVKGSCGNERLRGSLLSQQLVMRHVYADRDLKQIGIIDVAESDCSAPSASAPLAPAAPSVPPAGR
jgi:hypothetical protein